MRTQTIRLAMVLAIAAASTPAFAGSHAGETAQLPDQAPMAPRADAESRETARAYAAYLSALFEDMRTSPQADQRAFAALRAEVLWDVLSASDDGKTITADVLAARNDLIAELAESNAADLKVQWMIAGAPDNRIAKAITAAAIARVQQAESDNAAAWALSLPNRADGASAAAIDATLARMAASTRYDLHMMYPMSTLLEAMHWRPLPEKLVAAWNRKAANPVSADYAATVMAIAMTYSAAVVPAGFPRVCSKSEIQAHEARRDACITSGRLMLEKATTVIGLDFGEGVLRRLDALDAADADRARHVWWWSNLAASNEIEGEQPAYLDELVATGNEIEALRGNAERLGKVDPPANWQSAKEREPRE